MLRPLLLSLILSASAPAFAIYKCESAGKVSYSDTECEGGKLLNIDNAPSADATDATRQAVQDKKSLAELEKARSAEEAQAKKAAQRAAKTTVAKQKKCAVLARRKQRADEDVASAAGKSTERARRKANRISEEHNSECGLPKRPSLAIAG